MATFGVRRCATTAALALAVVLAGCAGGDPARLARTEVFGEANGGSLCGLVVDVEFLPVAGATVGASGHDRTVLTDPTGGFCLGPFGAGTEVELWVEADGYASATSTQRVGASDGPVTVILEPLPGLEPYHETVPHVAFIECAWGASFAGTLPCNPVDRTLGTSITVDNSQYFFDIPGPNLAALLFEAEWQQNQLGRDMRFILLVPDIIESNYATGEPMLDGRGSAPYRTWLYPGQEGERASQPFVGNESTPYQMLYRPWTTNSTTGVFAIYVQHRVESYYTFFYHRALAEDWTALPEK